MAAESAERRRLLDEGLAVTAAAGFRAASGAAVERRAGVSPGLLAREFASEDDWLDALYAHCLERRTEEYRVARERIDALVDASIEDGIDAIASFFTGPTWAAFAELQFAARAIPGKREAFRAIATAFDQHLGVVVPSFFRRGGGPGVPDHVVTFVMLWFDGLAFSRVVTEGLFDDVDASIDLLKRALRAELDDARPPIGGGSRIARPSGSTGGCDASR